MWKNDKTRIVTGLESNAVPVVYKALMCIWLVSFNATILADPQRSGKLQSLSLLAPAVASKEQQATCQLGHHMATDVVTHINKILQKIRTEKIVRIALQAVTNLLKNKAMCEEMAEGQIVDTISALEYEKWRDQELVEVIGRSRSQR